MLYVCICQAPVVEHGKPKMGNSTVCVSCFWVQFRFFDPFSCHLEASSHCLMPAFVFASSKFCSGLVSSFSFLTLFCKFSVNAGRLSKGGQFSSACPSFAFQFLAILSHISLEVSSQCCMRVPSNPWSVLDHGELNNGQFSSAFPGFAIQFFVILPLMSLEVSSKCFYACFITSMQCCWPWCTKMGNLAVCLSWFCGLVSFWSFLMTFCKLIWDQVGLVTGLISSW